MDHGSCGSGQKTARRLALPVFPMAPWLAWLASAEVGAVGAAAGAVRGHRRAGMLRKPDAPVFINLNLDFNESPAPNPKLRLNAVKQDIDRQP